MNIDLFGHPVTTGKPASGLGQRAHLTQVTELAVLVTAQGWFWGKSRDYIRSMSSIRRRRCGSIKPNRLSRTFWASSGVVTQRKRIVR